MHKSPAMLRGVRLGAALWRGTYVSGVRALVPRRTVRVARLQGESMILYALVLMGPINDHDT